MLTFRKQGASSERFQILLNLSSHYCLTIRQNSGSTLDRGEDIRKMPSIVLLLVILICVGSSSEAAKENTNPPKSFWPKAPFVDGCDGTPLKSCTRRDQCGWFELYIPW